MTITITSPLQKGDPLLKYLLALAPDQDVKIELSSYDATRQTKAANGIFESYLPTTKIYEEMFYENTKLATELRRTFNPRYFQHMKTSKLDVQHAVSRLYTTKTKLHIGNNQSRKFNIGNGHMLTAIEIQKLLLSALSTESSIYSLNDPAITVTHKVHGRCLLLRVDLFENHKVLTVCSRKGPAIGLFCRSTTNLVDDEKTESSSNNMQEEVWVDSSTGLGRYRLEAVDDRLIDTQPESWTSLDPAEFRTIRGLVPLLFGIVEQVGVDTMTFIGEGAGDNMTTLFDYETKRQIDNESKLETPAIYFFTARTPSGTAFDWHQLKDWELPVVNIIRSPSEQTKWSVKEIMDMWDQGEGAVTVAGQGFTIPPIVEFAGKQLCGEHDSYAKHPIEGVAISFGPWVVKAKNPYFADQEELEEEAAAQKKDNK